MSVLYAASSFYEILLIVLVIVLISNSLLIRRNIKSRIINSQDTDNDKVIKSENKKGEYVDYELIKD